MASVISPGPAVNRPAPGPIRGRWQDVPAAARSAAATLEMAIARSTLDGDTWIFELRSISDVPAELRVTAVPGEAVYSATANVGVFRDRMELAEQLLDAFDMRMRDLSRKPKFPTPSR